MGNARNKRHTKQEKAVISEVRKSVAVVIAIERKEEREAAEEAAEEDRQVKEILNASQTQGRLLNEEDTRETLRQHGLERVVWKGHARDGSQDFRSIVTEGSLEEVRALALTSEPPKWLLVTVQDQEHPLCARMNLLCWSHPTTKDIVKASFVFWPRLKAAQGGYKFVLDHNINSFPYLAVMNPFNCDLTEWKGKGFEASDVQSWLLTIFQQPPQNVEAGAEVQVAEVKTTTSEPLLVPLGTFGGTGGEWKEDEEEADGAVDKFVYEEGDEEEEEGGERWSDEEEGGEGGA